MEEAVFRTNHPYDPIVNQYQVKLPGIKTSTMVRYMIIKDGFNYYSERGQLIADHEAINITAAVAHKGGHNHYKCPKNDDGTNVISAVFIPGEQRMFMAFEEGAG